MYIVKERRNCEMEIANTVYLILGIWLAVILIHGMYRAGLEIVYENGRKDDPMLVAMKKFTEVMRNAGKASVSIGYAFEEMSRSMKAAKDIMDSTRYHFEPNFGFQQGGLVLKSVSLMPGQPRIVKTERTAEQFKQCAGCMYDWISTNHEITEKDGYCYMFEKFNPDCQLYRRINNHN